MSAICGKIFNGQAFDCNLKSTGGIVQEVVLVNRCDIDWDNTVLDRTLDVGSNTCSHRATSLVLKPGKTGYLVRAIFSKRLLSAGWTLNANTDSVDDYTHTLNLRLFNLCEESLCFIKGLGEGAEIIGVVQNNDRGTNNECAFTIYGLDRGLKITEATFNSNENKGTVPVVLASREPDFEPYPPIIYHDTDYATSLAAFENLYASP